MLLLLLLLPTIAFSQALWGAYVPNFYYDLDAFQNTAKRNIGVYLYYVAWPYDLNVQQLRDIRAKGVIPMLTWEPFLGEGTLGKIISGSYDWYIEKFANQVKEFGGPFFLRFAHEMNGDWYDWSEGKKGNSAGQYVQAWRKVFGIFKRLGANTPTLVWCPNIDFYGAAPYSQIYPGDDWVDWTCLDGYNWGGAQYVNFEPLFSPSYKLLLQIAPSKPIYIGEVATTPGDDKAGWIRDMFDKMQYNFPKVKGFNWFQINKEKDWRIDSNWNSAAAFAEKINNGYWTTNTYATLPNNKIYPPTSGASTSTTGGATGGCTDVSPNPQYTCAQQKTWGKCTEPWMAGYCKVSCGTCASKATADPNAAVGSSSGTDPMAIGLGVACVVVLALLVVVVVLLVKGRRREEVV